MNEVMDKKLVDAEVEMNEEAKDLGSCYFCPEPATEVRRFNIADDPEDAEAGGVPITHGLCWGHAYDYDEHEGIFDPFKFLE